jgi:tRNA A-37 threonylcarbamoyl transferase component Bud32
MIHALSIEHQDVEPRNIVTKKNEIRVIDFGLAEVGHRCDGMDECAVLQDLKEALSL